MRYVTLIVRLCFGLAFTVFGLNGVLMAFGKPFMPAPTEMPASAAAFFQAMTSTGYMMPLIGGTELVSGLMILTGVFAPLGLTLLAPVVVNIVLYHHFVDPGGLGIAYFVIVLELFLAYAYGPAFRGVLDPAAKPRWSSKRAECTVAKGQVDEEGTRRLLPTPAISAGKSHSPPSTPSRDCADRHERGRGPR